MIITVAAIKGGVGKTTISVALAESLSRAAGEGSSALLLDMDPQGSASGYFERTENLRTRCVPVVNRSVGKLSRLIRSAIEDEPIVVIDTPPGHIEIVDAAIGESDFVLVPTGPFVDPLTQAIETINMSEDLPSAILINRAKAGANDTEATREVLKGAKIDVLRTEVPDWVGIARIDGSRWTTDKKITNIFETMTTEILERVSKR